MKMLGNRGKSARAEDLVKGSAAYLQSVPTDFFIMGDEIAHTQAISCRFNCCVSLKLSFSHALMLSRIGIS